MVGDEWSDWGARRAIVLEDLVRIRARDVEASFGPKYGTPRLRRVQQKQSLRIQLLSYRGRAGVRRDPIESEDSIHGVAGGCKARHVHVSIWTEAEVVRMQ